MLSAAEILYLDRHSLLPVLARSYFFTVRTVKNGRPKTVVWGYLDYMKKRANTSACFSDVSAFWPPQVVVVLLLRVMPLIFQCLHLSMCTRPRGHSMPGPSNLAGIEQRKEDIKWRSKHSAADYTWPNSIVVCSIMCCLKI